MKENNHGQALTFLLILLPLLLLIFGIISRSGKTALIHDQVLNHCDKKVLDALAVEAQGLARIGDLNYFSRLVIQARRTVDALLAGTAWTVFSIPALLSAQRALKAAQHIIAGLQKTIKGTTIFGFTLTLNRPTPHAFSGKIHESYSPQPLMNFHLKDEEGYEDEVGAPQEPDSQFEEKAVASGKIKIFTERFLGFWIPNRTIKKSQDMFLECKAQIKLKRLEDKWLVTLISPGAKP